MRDLIGLDAFAAEEILRREGVNYTVKTNDGRRPFAYDSVLVVKAEESADGSVGLTTSRFLKTVDGR